MTGKARRPPRAPVAPVEETALPKGERVNLRIVVEADAAAFIAASGRSRALLKVGGRWRDHERWAINADQWRARRRADKRAA